MNFSEKLQLIRKNKGFTQEKLAELLNVSRQAVAKWEAGQAYPDITNLIHISEIFLVTIDYLVKNDMCQKQVRTENVQNEMVADFLVKAKKKTYAGKGIESEQTKPDSHNFTYNEGDFLYIDSYYGGECFVGEEVVWKAKKAIYSMNYSGLVLDKNFNGDFLKAALCEVPYDKPFRGLEFYQSDKYLYKCFVDGNIEWFQGYEEIYYENIKTYECYFHGGIVY